MFRSSRPILIGLPILATGIAAIAFATRGPHPAKVYDHQQHLVGTLDGHHQAQTTPAGSVTLYDAKGKRVSVLRNPARAEANHLAQQWQAAARPITLKTNQAFHATIKPGNTPTSDGHLFKSTTGSLRVTLAQAGMLTLHAADHRQGKPVDSLALMPGTYTVKSARWLYFSTASNVPTKFTVTGL